MNKFLTDPVGNKVMAKGGEFIICIIITAHMTPMLMTAISLLRLSMRNFLYELSKLHSDHFVPAIQDRDINTVNDHISMDYELGQT